MFDLPPDFEWLGPWRAIGDESDSIDWGRFQASQESGEQIANRLVDELQREMPEGHILKNCKLTVVGKCWADDNEYLFATDSPEMPLAMVHLTWRRETNPTWPFTEIYRSLGDWVAQMKSEHAAQLNRSAKNGG